MTESTGIIHFLITMISIKISPYRIAFMVTENSV